MLIFKVTEHLSFSPLISSPSHSMTISHIPVCHQLCLTAIFVHPAPPHLHTSFPHQLLRFFLLSLTLCLRGCTRTSFLSAHVQFPKTRDEDRGLRGLRKEATKQISCFLAPSYLQWKWTGLENSQRSDSFKGTSYPCPAAWPMPVPAPSPAGTRLPWTTQTLPNSQGMSLVTVSPGCFHAIHRLPPRQKHSFPQHSQNLEKLYLFKCRSEKE